VSAKVIWVINQEMKKIVRPMFEQNPEKYYPVETFKKIGFSRAQCKCGHYFWRKSETTVLCGDEK
jgi:alanyl-tRNA synthetase